MKLEPLTQTQCEQVRLWRNESLETLRTPFPLTKEQQEEFYGDVVCNRNSPHRYWAITIEVKDEICGKTVRSNKFIGMGGITNVQWENRIGEISLIIDPACRGKEFGEKAVDLLLDQAFNYMNLETLFGECYRNNINGVQFWKKIIHGYSHSPFTTFTWLMHRKYCGGMYHDSLYFSIDRDDFNKLKNETGATDSTV